MLVKKVSSHVVMVFPALVVAIKIDVPSGVNLVHPGIIGRCLLLCVSDWVAEQAKVSLQSRELEHVQNVKITEHDGSHVVAAGQPIEGCILEHMVAHTASSANHNAWPTMINFVLVVLPS